MVIDIGFGGLEFLGLLVVYFCRMDGYEDNDFGCMWLVCYVVVCMYVFNVWCFVIVFWFK